MKENLKQNKLLFDSVSILINNLKNTLEFPNQRVIENVNQNTILNENELNHSIIKELIKDPYMMNDLYKKRLFLILKKPETNFNFMTYDSEPIKNSTPIDFVYPLSDGNIAFIANDKIYVYKKGIFFRKTNHETKIIGFIERQKQIITCDSKKFYLWIIDSNYNMTKNNTLTIDYKPELQCLLKLNGNIFAIGFINGSIDLVDEEKGNFFVVKSFNTLALSDKTKLQTMIQMDEDRIGIANNDSIIILNIATLIFSRINVELDCNRNSMTFSNNRLYVGNKKEVLVVNALTNQLENKIMLDTNITSLLSIESDNVLIGTKDKGIVQYKNNRMKRVYMNQGEINHMVLIDKERIGIAQNNTLIIYF